MSKHDLKRISVITLRVLGEIQCAHQCVPAAAILLGCLHKTGYPAAYPLSLRAEIVNASGSHGVQLGHKQKDWAGHLAVVVPDYQAKNVLLDLTIPQVNQPYRGIVLDSMCLFVGEKFLGGLETHTVTANECRVTYEAFPDDERYAEVTNFNHVPGRDRAVGMILDCL
jgi:hypothetical protein